MPSFRSELSHKNQYFLPKHRTLELTHFCLQYPSWVASYNKLRLYPEQDLAQARLENAFKDSTAEQAIRLKFYKDKIDMIEQAADDTDEELRDYILKSVTEGKKYEWFRLNENIPCCRDTFYQLRRRFFWILNHYRD